MMNCHKFLVLISILMVNWTQISVLASVVSTGDFNKDFYVMWSPNHINTSSDGRARSLILDKDSGTNCLQYIYKLNLIHFHFYFMVVNLLSRRCWFRFKWDVLIWPDWHANQTGTGSLRRHSHCLLRKYWNSLYFQMN